MPGIDYGMGTTNIDPETGIRYGCISQHSVMPEVLSEMEYDYGPPICPECNEELSESDEGEKDYLCPACSREWWSDEIWDMVEPIGMYLDQPDLKVCDCLDSDLLVIKSPYFTHTAFCSPCVPGAGNLDEPCEDGVKCYCLGHDWFEDKAPYPVYRVDTGELVEA